MSGGYMEKILRIDLSEGKLTEIPYPDEWKEKYLGGSGVAARIIYDEVTSDIDAFDPKNALCFFTGPYTGTPAPSSGRYGVAAKSPLTGGWGESSCSGYWAPELKFAGFDGVIVKGKSEKPVYLYINDGKPELMPAKELWGRTTLETEHLLKDKHGDKIKITSIGPAGEKLVRFACIISDEGRAAGRCGLGAVMGSKNLKAIAVQGTEGVPIANKEKLDELRKEAAKIIRKSVGLMFQTEGTSASVGTSVHVGDFPVKNWQLGNFPDGAKLDSAADYRKILVKKWPCYRCQVACGRWVKLENEVATVQPFEGHGPEYETLGVFGGALLNSNIETIAAANYVCNNYGLDTISTGGIIAFAYEAYDKGILNKADIGFDLKWGDGEAAVKLARMIAERKGIGELLGEGPVIASKKIGKGSEEFALHVKGMGIPAHDPRVYAGVAGEYALSNRGACHLQGFVETWQGIESFYGPELGLDMEQTRIFSQKFGDLHTSVGKGMPLYKVMAMCNTFDALPFCKFIPICDLHSGKEICELTNAITGMDLTPTDIITIGERLIALKRSFNMRCGLTRADDRLPDRLLIPAPDAPEQHGAIDLDIQMKEFYEAADWDWESGKPNKDRLVKLGLSDVVKDLWPN